MGQTACFGDVFAPAFTADFEDLAQHARTCLAPKRQTLGVEQVRHDDEAVAIEDALRALDLVGFENLDVLQSIVLTQMFAQAFDVGIVIGAPRWRTWIDGAARQLWHERNAMLVRRFVRRRGRAPADARFAVDLQAVQFAHVRHVGMPPSMIMQVFPGSPIAQ